MKCSIDEKAKEFTDQYKAGVCATYKSGYTAAITDVLEIYEENYRCWSNIVPTNEESKSHLTGRCQMLIEIRSQVKALLADAHRNEG